MRPYLASGSGIASIVGIATSVGIAWAQAPPELAAEGRGLLPTPTAATPAGPSPVNPFELDPSGGFSRIVFETGDDFSFPPDRQTQSRFTFGEPGEVSIAKKRLALTAGARTAVPAGAPNRGNE